VLESLAIARPTSRKLLIQQSFQIGNRWDTASLGIELITQAILAA